MGYEHIKVKMNMAFYKKACYNENICLVEKAMQIDIKKCVIQLGKL